MRWPVRLIVGFDAGGAADILARLMGQWLSERLGQQFVAEACPASLRIQPSSRHRDHSRLSCRAGGTQLRLCVPTSRGVLAQTMVIDLHR